MESLIIFLLPVFFFFLETLQVICKHDLEGVGMNVWFL